MNICFFHQIALLSKNSKLRWSRAAKPDTILLKESAVIQISPTDFIPLEQYCREQGGELFRDPKLLHYHTKPIQRELIEAGAMARVGRLLFVHRDRFFPEYQRIVAAAKEAA